jgi:hypothetical protein
MLHDLDEKGPGLLGYGEDSDIPSWIPDWRHSSHEKIYLLLNNRFNCHYRASGESKPVARFQGDEELIVEGFQTDTIVAATGWPSDDELEGPKILQNDWKLWQTGKHPRGLYGDQMQQQLAFIHSIAGGRDRNGRENVENLTVEVLNRFFDIGLDDSGATENPDAWFHVFSEVVPLIHVLHWFAFCTTKKGRMGRVPCESQSGDIIAILSGGRTPYVLRKYKESDKYYLVGECCRCCQAS